MEIQVCSTDSETSSFTLTDEERGVEIIESIKPSEFFNQPHLRIQNGTETTIFNMNAVESIRFQTSSKARVREQPPAKILEAIPDTEYAEKLENLKRDYDPFKPLIEPGQRITTLLAMHFLSGRKLFLHAEIVAGFRVEQLSELQNRLDKLTAVIPCAPEGYLAINPHSIKKIEMYPAPPEARQPTVWSVT